MTSGNDQPVAQSQQRPMARGSAVSAGQPANLADLLERVLDKGIVIAGDITLSLGTIELLTLRIRLLIASVDKAQEIGIDWWKSDPALSSRARNQELEERVKRLEDKLGSQDGEVEAGGASDRLEDRLARLESAVGGQKQDQDQKES
jgi:gas vesicle protein GvpA/GvpJ/GvpM family